jgi:hypothetical protein
MKINWNFFLTVVFLILGTNIGNFFDNFLDFKPLTYNEAFPNILYCIFLPKWGDPNVPPRYRIKKHCQLLNTWTW